MSEREKLVARFAADFMSGRSYRTIIEARQQASAELGQAVQPGTALAKLVDECVEAGLTLAAREIVKSAPEPTEAYEQLVALHERQPTLGVRSSTSVRQQAYSTVLPVAYLAANLAGIDANTLVYEPTAGHGALLLKANPANVTVNELNADRAADLRAQGFNVTEYDATTYVPDELHDVVIANPPFGRVKGEDGRAKRFSVPGLTRGTSQIDQAIALQSLRVMKDEGRAVLILGSKPGRDEAERSEEYNTLESRGFFYTLYEQYNVTQHFTVSGNLYRKQGAVWPIDVVVIEGREKSKLPLPAAQVPIIYESFEALKELLKDDVQRSATEDLRRIPELPESLDTEGRGGSEPIYRESAPGVGGDELESVSGTHQPPGSMDDARVAQIGGGESGANSPTTDESTIPTERRPGSAGPVRAGRTEGVDASFGMDLAMGGSPDRDQRDLENPIRPGESRDRVSSDPPSAPSSFSTESDGETRLNYTGPFSDGTDLRNVTQVDSSSRGTMEMNEQQIQPDAPLNVPYMPRSKGRGAGTLIPANMAAPAQVALDNVEKKRGNIDEFVIERLGLTKQEELWEVFYAEQVDSIALALDQQDNSKIFVNGDQTGNGKGRFGAAMIVDAQRRGYIPVFVTQKPNLYSAMLSDLSDIGRPMLRPFMTNNDLEIKTDDGRKFKTGAALDQELEMTRISQNGLGSYDAVFTTYDQLQTVSKKEPFRRQFMRAIAERAVFIFDEAHEAGGSTGQSGWKIQGEAPNRSEFVRELVDRSAGAVFMSATAAKDPAVMDLYARRTDAIYAVASMENLEQTLKAGGIPLQQMMATKFVASGNLLRRERSFENISFDAKVVPVNKGIADGISGIMRAIDAFDQAKAGALKDLASEVKKEAKKAGEDNAIGQAGLTSTNFTSLMHNAIEQGLLCQKAEATVQEAIAALDRGEKPLIAVASTMDSFIKQYAEAQGLKPGDSIEVTFGDILERYLERSRDVVITDYMGLQTRRPMTEEELGGAAYTEFLDAKALIEQTDLSGIPLSSIDYIRARLTQEGYRVDEITGRKNMIEYGSNGSMTYRLRADRDIKPQGKIEIVNRFNSGTLDVVILNRSGATGISLHASEKFKDQQQRHMIVAQCERDINQVMQMLGRANRFGQVIEPKFTLLMSDLPAEKRLGAMLTKKMASLNANTTAARNSDMSISGVTDFMNAAGEEVITELLKEDPELDAMLSFPSAGIPDNSGTELISRVTGRIPLLSIQDQEALYELIETDTKALIEQKEAMGENVLEADKLDLDARTIARMVVVPEEGALESEFTGPVHLEVVDTKIVSKPLTQLQVINTVRENLGLAPINSVSDHDFDSTQAIAAEKAEQRMTEVVQAVDRYRQDALQRSKTPDSGIKLQERLDLQLAQFRYVATRFVEGTSVQLATADGSVAYGVVGRIWQKEKVKGSPVAPTHWRIQVLTDNRAKQVTVPFSKVNTSNPSSLTIIPQRTHWSGTDIYEAFDLKQTDQRTEMQLFTGNLLKAYEKYAKGKFVNFTDHRGQIRQGLIMPDAFDIQEELRKEPVAFKEPHQVKAFMTEVTSNQGVAQDLERNLSIKVQGQSRYAGGRAETFVMSVASSTSFGGKYFLNEDLIEAAGGEFYSVSNRMELAVPAERIDRVLNVLMKDLGVTLVAFDYKDLARQYLGELLPQMEMIEANQFAEQGDYVPYVPEPTQTTIEQLESLLNLENPPAPLETPPKTAVNEPIAEQLGLEIVLPQIEPLQRQEPVSVQIAESSQQVGAAEKNIAKLLHQGGLIQTILEGEGFHLRVENPPYIPLVIERHGNEIYLTHYLEQNGDLFLDTEMVFKIKAEGHLTLTQTAVQDPIRGGEIRSLSRQFGKLFSSNLLDQGFGQAITQALDKSAGVEIEPEATPQVEAPKPQSAQRIETNEAIEQPVDSVTQINEKLQKWSIAARALSNNKNYHRWVSEVINDFESSQVVPTGVGEQLEKDLATHESKLNQLKEWYRAAMSIGKPSSYLNRIAEVGEGFKSGQPLHAEAVGAMTADFSKADWMRLSQGVQEDNPQQLTTRVAARALREGKSHRDILLILESDPSFQFLMKNQGLNVAQDYRKRSLLEALHRTKSGVRSAHSVAERESKYRPQSIEKAPNSSQETLEPNAQAAVNRAFLIEARQVLDNLSPNDLPGDRYWQHRRYTITETQNKLSVYIVEADVTVQNDGESITGNASQSDVNALKRANIAIAAIESQSSILNDMEVGE
jgi:C-terminal domain on Strawberry notch homologue/P-loop containing NTP hydrolase pore-1